MSGEHAVILVDSTSHALRIEKFLGQHGIPCKLIPVPRRLSSDCGVCVRIDLAALESARRLVSEHQIQFQSFEVI